jgi:exodeoxyribonuclease-3
MKNLLKFWSGFLQQVFDEQPDILCLQEVKASMENIPELLKNMDDYHLFLNHYHNPAYAGVALFTRSKPQEVFSGFLSSREDGRVIQAQYDDFKIYNKFIFLRDMIYEKLENKFNFKGFLKTMEKESSDFSNKDNLHIN